MLSKIPYIILALVIPIGKLNAQNKGKLDSGVIKARVHYFYNQIIMNTCNCSLGKIERKIAPIKELKKQKVALHGNFTYEFIYRSHIDTPFQQSNFQQHILRVNLKSSINQSIPVNYSFALNYSNSPFYRNLFDLNLNFDIQEYKKIIADKLSEKIENELKKKFNLNGLEQKYKEELGKINNLLSDNSSPEYARKQYEALLVVVDTISNKLIEAHPDLEYRKYLKTVIPELVKSYILKSISHQNLNNKLKNYYGDKQGILDSVLVKSKKRLYDWENAKNFVSSKSDSISAMLAKITSIKRGIKDSVQKFRNEILYKPQNVSVKKLLNKKGMDQDSLLKGTALFNLNYFNIGRSMINYSDLTINNLSITGISTSFTKSGTYKLAYGNLDYRFRDFVFRNAGFSKQPVFAFQYGFSGFEDRGMFLTMFRGRKNDILNNTNNILPQFINGYSVGYKLLLTTKHHLSVEFAKTNSQLNAFTNTSTNEKTGPFDFTNRANEALSFHYVGSLNKDNNTKIVFRKIGSAFQSFNFFFNNSNQHSYNIETNQGLIKNKIHLKLGVSKNSYEFPYLSQVNTNLLYKTAIINLRLKKFPSISFGFIPSQQTVLLNDTLQASYLFNTITFNAFHTYKLFKTINNSAILYSKLSYPDFDTSNGSSMLTVQHRVFRKLNSFQAGYHFSKIGTAQIETYEGQFSQNFKNNFSVSVGLKYNQINNDFTKLGYSAQIQLNLKKIGVLSLYADKSYLPVWRTGKVAPVTNGRLIYSKTF